MFKISAYSFLISASLWSCIPAYNVSSKEFRKAKADFPKQKVFVANKNLKKEFEILKHSKIYDIVEDSTQVMKITLHPMETRTPACGNPMIGSMMTLGLVPSGFPYDISYSYDTVENNTTKNYQYKLQVYQSLWLFNIFRLGKTFSKQSGKALLGSYIASNK
ncbi:hypothetical protein EGY07_07095 [Chryseobacterium indologenes]|uniref:hypothetical protein n=1 Tax=Chryseobacterium TaxID=59732 RepID=UPI000486AB70|nr:MULTISPECIES: hypothetical protein [Chryseobacterium]AYZ35352.1 hypothetical protein EGY07_07095 [Chryseobacterium indologenes]MBF6644096.1 hypothetical protein [Chryseobacterium indologenes]MBU3048040.1 hypothetical protein [Chryseobacterium indologenes]MEB4763301.1 hypothetical protein [Chryseobacterium indologenes]QQQ72185.1 hypothetical protein JHW31_05520 [Chryseobacterium indologenes]